MAQGRVDQITYPGALQDHDRRIKILERVKQTAGECTEDNSWDSYGDTTLIVDIASTGGCAVVTTPPTAHFTGLAYSPCVDDVTTAHRFTPVSGQMTMTFKPGDAPGQVDISGCTGPDVFQFCYAITPPFFSGCLGDGDRTPFGYGVTIQAATGLVLPAYLVQTDITQHAWGIYVPGVDTFEPYGTNASANFARPGTLDGQPGYPFDWGNNDIPFTGSFTYYVNTCD